MAGKFERTLFDYRGELHWVSLLGWPDDDLRQVPVHEQATAGEEYLNLSNFGNTALGVTSRAHGGPASADVRALRNLYVYSREVPERLYRKLERLADQGGPDAYDASVFGEGKESGSAPPAGGS